MNIMARAVMTLNLPGKKVLIWWASCGENIPEHRWLFAEQSIRAGVRMPKRHGHRIGGIV